MAVVLLGLGSNIEREKHISSGLDALRKNFGVIECSSIYESEAIGFQGEAFYNLVVKVSTDLKISQLIVLLRNIENANGRIANAVRLSSRTLDIDLLTYDDCVGISEGVELPRDEILTNAFVLWPLAELVPHDTHPLQMKTYEVLWNAFDQTQQKIRKLTRETTI